MTQLRIHRHRFGISTEPPQVIEVPHVGKWLVDRFERGQRTVLQVFRGQPSAGTEISRDFDALMASDAPVYTVLESPGTDPFTWFQVILTVYSVASAFMASKPDMPANVNRTQQSPNNALGSRENQVRLLQRVEDIFGKVKSIPSLMMPTYTKYIDNIKVEYGYYCVGRGYYAITDVKDGDTLISAITGSSAAFYRPFTSPNSGTPYIQIGPAIIDRIVSVRRAVEVDGITLKAQNQIQLEPDSGYYFLPPGPAGGMPAPPGSIRPTLPVPAAATDRVVQFYKRPNFNAVVTAGQTVTFTVPDTTQVRSGTVEVNGAFRRYFDQGVGAAPLLFERLVPGGTVTFAGFVDPENNGTFTVLSKEDERTVTMTTGSQVTADPQAGITVTVALPGSAFSGTRTVLEVGDGWLILAGATFPYQHDDPLSGGTKSNMVANNGLTDWTDWVTLSVLDRIEIWANVLALNGMYKDDGGRSGTSVAYAMEMQQLDGSLNPIGGVVTATGSLSGVTTEERAETLEYATAWTGPTRVRMRRLTPYDYFFQGQVVDEIKWADLYSVSPVNKADFGNKTTVHTVTQATARSTAVKSRQLNCIASRMLPKWTGSGFTGAFDADGRHVSGDLYETALAQDIIAALTLDPKIGNRPITDLDMPQLQNVVDQLYAIHPDLPTFNYTLDSDSLSFEDTVDMVANAAFSKGYRQSGKVRLALDRQQTNSAALFTHRNKAPQSVIAEVITRTFANDSAYDGVEFVYADPDTQQNETIRLPLDGSATKYKKFEIPGIRSYVQAWIRACREYEKLRGQRLTIETNGTTDARLLLPNTRIDIVDNTRFKAYDGEVIGQDGLLLTLSQRVSFEAGGSHSIVLLQRNGGLQGITVTAVAGRDDQVLLASLPAEAVKTSTDVDGVATIYSFAADSARAAQAWLVTEIDPPKDNYVTIRAVNYSDRYYYWDTQPIPPKESVIN